VGSGKINNYENFTLISEKIIHLIELIIPPRYNFSFFYIRIMGLGFICIILGF